MLRVLPAHDKLASQQVTYTSAYEVASARNFIQSNVSIQVTCSNLICGQTSLKVGGITRNITRLSNAAKILHIFVLPVYRSLEVRELVKS